MASRDVFEFINAADCKDAAREIANKVVLFANHPNENEVLSRCRHVFEYILHYALADIKDIDLNRFTVEVENEEE